MTLTISAYPLTYTTHHLNAAINVIDLVIRRKTVEEIAAVPSVAVASTIIAIAPMTSRDV